MARGDQPPALGKEVADFICRHRLVKKGCRVVVAVSGGPDSVCLLHLLAGLRQELGIDLHAAHLDHQIRGEESAADAAYVAELARSLDIPLTTGKEDVNAYRQRKRISLEEAAREVRYRFLADAAATVGADYIATGHTLDDHIETVLMHIIRGTGVRGLTGLRPIKEWRLNGRKVNIIRPLLEISRGQTAAYCQQRKLNPRLDSTNLSLSPLRNRVRKQLLPLLEEYNPGIREALLRTAAAAEDEVDYFDTEVAGLWQTVVKDYDGILALDKKALLSTPSALKRHLLRAAIEKLLGSLKDIETRHIEAVMSALDKPAGRRLNLPQGLLFYVDYDRYLLGRDLAKLCPYPVIGGEYKLNIPGETQLPGWIVKAEIIEIKEGKSEGALAPSETNIPLPFVKGKGIKGLGFKDDAFSACVDLEKTGTDLTMRRRRPGDFFRPLGMNETKKVNRFMIDEKLPQFWRARIPIVCSPMQILWLVGYRIDDRAKVTEKTKRVLRLEFKKL